MESCGLIKVLDKSIQMEQNAGRHPSLEETPPDLHSADTYFII